MFMQYCPTKVFLGSETTQYIPDIVSQLASRVLIVTDTMISDSEPVKALFNALENQGINTIKFDEITGKVTSNTVDNLIDLAKGSRTQLVLGIGGVQTLSLAKAGAAFCGMEGVFSEKIYSLPKNETPLHYMEIPTSIRNPELLTNGCWITDKKTRLPYYISTGELFPHAVFLLPELQDSLSRIFFYAALMDLFLLSVEGYVSQNSNFLCDTLFLKAIATILGIQQKDESQYKGLESIENALQAGLLYAYGKTTTIPGLGQTLCYAINSRFRIPKSVTAAIILPQVLQHAANREPSKIARMANMLEIPKEDLPDSEIAQRVVETVRFHIGLEGIPNRMSDFNVSLPEFKELCTIAANLPHITAQQIELEEMQQIIENSY